MSCSFIDFAKCVTTSEFARAHACHALYHVRSRFVARRYDWRISGMASCFRAKVSDEAEPDQR